MIWRFYKKRPLLVLAAAMLMILTAAVGTFTYEPLFSAYAEVARPVRPGWNLIDDRWYWYTSAGEKLTGWKLARGKWYYLSEEDGAMVTGLYTVDGKDYFFNEDGVMHTGWLKLDGKWYFFTASGYKKIGWIYDGDGWYYADADGVMQTGWQQVRGSWYYFSGSGKMQTGWITTKTGKYYLSESGSMVSNGWWVNDGHSYHFNSNGKLDVDTTKPQSLVSMPGYYISPMYAGNLNTTEERIEAMIRRAYDYKNAKTTYKICKSMAPGQYADCSGLVMQCLYAAGFDPAPATPAHHARPENEFDSRTLYKYVNMRHVSYSEIKRGDLIFYKNEKYNVIIHVAIYLGDGKVIESWPPAVTDKYGVSSYPHKYIYGVARPFE